MKNKDNFDNFFEILRTEHSSYKDVLLRIDNNCHMIELNKEQFNDAIDSLESKVLLCGAGVDELSKHEKLLVLILREMRRQT